MGGIFISDVMDLRIPGLRLALGDKPDVSMDPVELRMELWPYWLDIGIDHGVEALATRQRLMKAKKDGDDKAKAEFLRLECKAGMIALCAAAFTLDSFYARVFLHRDMTELKAAWDRARTPRSARISETLRQNFQMDALVAKEERKSVQELFKFRDWAVHPPADFRQAVWHEALETGVEWRFKAFGAENAAAAVFAAAQLIKLCILNPRPGDPEFLKWCEGARKRGSERWERAKREFEAVRLPRETGPPKEEALGERGDSG